MTGDKSQDSGGIPLIDTCRRSYTLKFVGSFAVVLVLIGAIGGFIAVSSSAALTEDAQQDLQATAESKAQTLDTWASNSQHVASLVATSEPIQSGETDRIKPYVDRLVEDDELTAGARAIHYIDATDTTILTSTLDDRVGGNPREEGAPWAQQDLTAVPDDEVIVTAFNPTVANVTVITFVTPVPGEAERAIVYVTTLAGIEAELDASTETGFTVVVDDQGTTVFHSQNASAVGDQHIPGPGVDSPAVEAGLGGESGFVRMDDIAMGYAPMDSLDWVVMSHEPTEAVFGLQQSIVRNLAALILVAVLGFGAIGLTIGRNTIGDIRTLAEKANRMEDGELDVTVETGRQDELGELYRAFDNMRDSIRGSLEEQIEKAEQAREEAEQAREEAQQAQAESEAFSEHLEETAADYETVMRACAEGDLTRRLEPDEESGAMAAIAVAFNEMLDELEATIVELQSFAQSVATASDEMAASSDEIEQTSAEVAESIETIAAGAQQQDDHLGEVSEEMTDLSATIEEIASSSNEVAQRSQEAVEMGADGRELSSEAIEKMDQVDRTTAETVEQIRELNDRMDQIVEIVDLIDGIAEETNTLALNASIEAARADEAGDGFAVVANEVKTLAEETREATEEIEDRITDVRDSTAEVVEEMEETQQLVETGISTVEEGLQTLEEIVETVEDANTGVQSINDATDEQAQSSQQVVTMIEKAAEVSSETVEEADSVSAAAEQQSSAVSEIASNADDLSAQARRLRERLETFETEGERVVGTGSELSSDEGISTGASTDD